ncbi:hypothetical protein BY458DRAFT_257272 [Sporodiniella umbellata]|nr:hypothetical protein BY458DRAFT_257272 [Sporodiniella umbellata]
MICIFSPVTTVKGTPQTEEAVLLTPTICVPMNYKEFQLKYSLLTIKNGQAGYEVTEPVTHRVAHCSPLLFAEPSINLEIELFAIYFESIHPVYPLLYKQSIINVHSRNRNLLYKPLRYAIMTLASVFHHKNISSTLYQLAKKELGIELPTFDISMLPIRLDTVQTLLLLYKYDSISPYFLEIAHNLLNQIPNHTSIPQQHQEMIRRAHWILFTSVALSNLSEQACNSLCAEINIPVDLPQPLNEELQEQDGLGYMNRFSQVVNLSVLHYHTTQSLSTESYSNLICINQFKSIRQHWYDTLNAVTQRSLVSQQETTDVLILYNAVLYDILYLLLLLHNYDKKWHHHQDAVEISYHLQRMVQKWIVHPLFTSAIQSRRMAVFALLLCLQVHMLANTYDCVENIRLMISSIQPADARIEHQLNELQKHLTFGMTPCSPYEQPQQDYFSLRPRTTLAPSASSTPSLSTPICLNSPLSCDKEWNLGPLLSSQQAPSQNTLLQEQLQQLQIETDQ